MFIKRIQIGLIHSALAISLVPINSTLNRVMIKELAVAATLVALLASLPYLFSPIQVVIGSFSDRHPILGFKRTPYILLGLVLCVAGVMTAPLAAFLIPVNFWAGLGLGVLTFGAWGMGFNFAAVSYFSLASEISGPKGRSFTIAVMFFIMIVCIILVSLGLGRLLETYSELTLIRSFWVVGLTALMMGLLGLVGLEKRITSPKRLSGSEEIVAEGRYSIRSIFQAFRGNRQMILFFWYLILMLTAIMGQDVLLEPYAAEAFGLPVDATTRITSLWGLMFLVSLSAAGLLESRLNRKAVARLGAWGGILAFTLISTSGLLANVMVFYGGVILLGLATGLATVSNLALMLDMVVPGMEGMFIGAWGVANAFSRLTGAVMSGIIRDLSNLIVQSRLTGYVIVFVLEAVILLISLLLLRRIDVSAFQRSAVKMSVTERAVLGNEG